MSSLISQWCSQHQQANYRIILQSTTGLSIRLQAANSLSTFGKEKFATGKEDEETVYRRARLRTPTESALRDLLGGPAWLIRILEVGVEEDCQVIFVKTQSRHCFPPRHILSKIMVLDASQDPWGWNLESEGETTSEQREANLAVSQNNLSALYESINHSCEQKGQTPVLLVWESLTPLFLAHGFDLTLRFLQELDASSRTRRTKDCRRVLQVWSVRMETLTASQHAKLEDSANALMYMNRGEMTLMRQGIREAGNVVREVLPFRLVSQETGKAGDDMLRFRLEEQDDISISKMQDEDTTLSDERRQSAQDKLSSDPKSTTKPKPGRSKIKLRLESDDEQPSVDASDSTRPRIFLQDDDPEFDDMDEEDPDDDLDI